jgi:hypothetical protein
MSIRCAMRAAALVAALTTGAATAAQAQSPIKLGIAGGVALPVSDVADSYDAGYNGTVTLAFNAPLVPVGLRVDGMFNRLSAKDDLLDAPDLDVSAVNANITYTLLPLPVARIYLIGGAGYYSTKFRDTDLDSQGKVGYNGGAGVRIGAGGAQLFAEARYHRVNLDNDAKLEFVPVTIGFMF